MKTRLLTISLSFTLLASAQIPQFAPKCTEDNAGVNATEIRTEPGSNGTPWNYSNNKDKAYYNGVLYTGIVKVCGKNTGKVMSKLSFKNGIKDGLSYKYHKEGWLQWKKNYANGKEDGHQKYFYPSDMMAMNNNSPGKTADLNLNRRIKESYWANNGKKDGKARAYYANGDMKYLEIYDNGKMHGDQIYYYKDSILERKEHYVNGVKDGDQMYYDEKKNLIGEESWENGKQISGYKLYTGVIQSHLAGTIQDEKISIFVWYKNLGRMNWDEAVTECAALGTGWRLPTKKELNSLYAIRDQIDIFEKNRYNFWSSEEVNNKKAFMFCQYAKGYYLNCTVITGFQYVKLEVGDWGQMCKDENLIVDVLPVKTFNP